MYPERGVTPSAISMGLWRTGVMIIADLRMQISDFTLRIQDSSYITATCFY